MKNPHLLSGVHLPLKVTILPYLSLSNLYFSQSSPSEHATIPQPSHVPVKWIVPGVPNMRKEHQEVSQADGLLLGGDATLGDHPDQSIDHGVQ